MDWRPAAALSVSSYHLSGADQSLIQPIQESWSLHLICSSARFPVQTLRLKWQRLPPKASLVSLFQTLNIKKSLKLQTAHFYPLWTWPLTFGGILNSVELAAKASTFRTTHTCQWRRTLLKRAFKLHTDCKSFKRKPRFYLTLLQSFKKKKKKTFVTAVSAVCRQSPKNVVFNLIFFQDLVLFQHSKESGCWVWVLNIQGQTLRWTRAAQDLIFVSPTRATKHSRHVVPRSSASRPKIRVLWLKL